MKVNLRAQRREGYVLIAVLIVIVVLALVAYRFTDSMTTEYRSGVRTADTAKLRAAAMSGITQTMASMADPNTFATVMGNLPLNNNPQAFSNILICQDPDNPQRGISYSIVCVVPTATPGYYLQQNGVIDEGGKININALIALDPSGNTLYNTLMAFQTLPTISGSLMTPQIASNIVAWVSPATAPPPTAAGAPPGVQSSTYESLPYPYQAKNGPLNSLDELLLVQGVTPQMLYGTDQNMNGIQDGTEGSPLDRGWQDYLTVHGRELNVSSAGTLRINVNGDDLNGIYTALQSATTPIDSGMAAYIMAAKLYGTTPYPPPPVLAVTVTMGGGTSGKSGKGGSTSTGTGTLTVSTAPAAAVNVGTSADLITAVQNSLTTTTSGGKPIASILALKGTQVTLPAAAGAKKDAPKTVVRSPLNDTNTLMQFLPSLMDQLTTTATVEMIPRLNVSTASAQALLVLPGLSPLITTTDVDAIIAAQPGLIPGDPATTSGAWLVTQGGLSVGKYQAISKYVTGSSLMYRVQAVGYYTDNSGNPIPNTPMSRVEAVIDTGTAQGTGYPRIVSVRDLTSLDNPRGFQMPLMPQQP